MDRFTKKHNIDYGLYEIKLKLNNVALLGCREGYEDDFRAEVKSLAEQLKRVTVLFEEFSDEVMFAEV